MSKFLRFSMVIDIRGPYPAFGKLMRQARLDRDLTQTSVSTAIGRTSHHYNYIELGQRLPSMKTFALLQHCLGFDANTFLDALNSVPKPFSALGQLLARTRKSKGKTITEMAEALGCGTEHYWRLEAGAELPTIMMFVRLHRGLGFDAGNALRSIPMGAALDPGEVWAPHFEFGRLLRKARIEREMMLADVSGTAAVSERYYMRLEAGCQLPSLKHFARLQRCLGFDANQLLDAISGDPRPFAGFAHRLATARMNGKRTATEAAAGAGCEPDRYQRIESGAELPTLMELVRLHRILDLNADETLLLIPVETEPTTSDSDGTSLKLDRARDSEMDIH
jgi:transcriptional regulator with XRE-family HTH domain